MVKSMAENIKIFKTNKSSVIVTGLLFTIALLFLIYSSLELKGFVGGENISPDYSGFSVIFLLTLAFLNIFLYNLKKKIIVSDEGIRSIEIPVSPSFLYGKKTDLKINWDEIKILSFRKGFLLRSNIHYVISKNRSVIAFTPVSLENGKELVSCIEERTGRKFS